MFVFFFLLINNDEETITPDDLRRELRNIIGTSEARHVINRFEAREHKLFKKELIEHECQDGLEDTEQYRLTQKAINEFLSDFDYKKKTKHRVRDFILAKNISVKKLFYNEKNRSRIDELTELLQKDNFAGIQNRLKENGMRTGFACIFSGLPGTGKTETVYQIARDTGRDIMLVDIAESKSKWFGESEKLIKAVFNRYRNAVKDCNLAPILLFNEADAILGKRREFSQSRSGPEQTENAIQNIILQEMENLNGILIATTNLTINLDKAFERRFLYKIEFEKPDAVSKKMIWQSIIPSLCDSNAKQLADEFDFSGGQIENIARKSTVSFILNGTTPDISVLKTFCSEELLEKTAVKIGFTA
jgi:SpoVK/Ycf46/Vps4 family AAA+-type ATPase